MTVSTVASPLPEMQAARSTCIGRQPRRESDPDLTWDHAADRCSEFLPPHDGTLAFRRREKVSQNRMHSKLLLDLNSQVLSYGTTASESSFVAGYPVKESTLPLGSRVGNK